MKLSSKIETEKYQKAGFRNLQYYNIQDEKWRLFANAPTAPDGKRNTALGNKVSTNLKETIDNAMISKPLLSLWHKIDTLHETSHIKLATKKAPPRQLRWAAILAAKELPTGK